MKIRTETNQTLSEPEIVIRCHETYNTTALRASLTKALAHQQNLLLKKDDKEYYISPTEILFFESADGRTYAHTATDIFTARSRLYELSESLPNNFIRASKSIVINTSHVLSLTRNLAGSSLLEFRNSHKRTNVSRRYFKQLRDKLNERS